MMERRARLFFLNETFNTICRKLEIDVHELEWQVEMAMDEMPHGFGGNRSCPSLRVGRDK